MGRLRGGNADDSDELVASTPACLFEMRGRSMKGWLRVDAEDVRAKPALKAWVKHGVTHARSLPPKR